LTNFYIQKTKGELAFDTQLIKDRNKVIAFAKEYKHPVVDESYTNLMDLLNANSYQKGGWVLHMLRTEIGDSLFQQTIRTYYNKFRLSNADTKDFQQVVESVSKLDLDWFFKQWLYQAEIPTLKISNEIVGKTFKLKISQKEYIFRFPMTVEIKLQNGETILEKIQITEKETLFTKEYASKIGSFRIDPTVDLLFQEY
jgi:aminopeptidase N